MTNRPQQHGGKCVTLGLLLLAGGVEAAELRPLPIPEDVMAPSWVEGRQLEQELLADDYAAFHDFKFSDQQPRSGIDFVHRVVADAARDYKAVHYDHGNAVAAADVDGDGLTDLYFANQLGSNSLWRNVGNGKFVDATAGANVGVADRISVGAAFADIDNDGDADLYVTSVRAGNVLLLNDGKGVFEDASKSSGLDYKGHSSGAVFFDYDSDGLLDLFVANVGTYTIDEQGEGDYWIGMADAFAGQLHPERYESSRLYRNLGDAKFADVTKAAGLLNDAWNGDAAVTDLDLDGDIDLYLPNMQGHDLYFRNEGGRFVDASRALFPVTPWGAMGVAVLDFENDGRPDIFVTDMHTDMVDELGPREEKSKMPRNYPVKFMATDGRHIAGNAFYSNRGDDKMVETSNDIGAENFWPWGLSTADLNADGFDDAFITASMNYPYRYGINSVLLNERGQRFVDAEYVLGVEPRRDGATAAPWFVLDCDAQDREHKHCQNRAGKYEVWGALGSRSSVIFDLDSDGDLDIVTNDFNSAPMVLISNLSTQRKLNYLSLDLVGRTANRDALGALVTITAGKQKWVRALDGKSGYLAQSQLPLYFGLDAVAAVDHIHIRWPGGDEQVIDGPIASNQQLRIEQAAERVAGQ